MMANPVEKEAKDGMLSIPVPLAIGNKIKVDGGESAEQMHITLFYFGEELSPENRQKITNAASEFAKTAKLLDIELAGTGVFEQPEQKVLYAKVISSELVKLRADLAKVLDDNKIEYSKDYENYTPHVTLKYVTDGIVPDIKVNESITADGIEFCFGQDKKSIPFGATKGIPDILRNPELANLEAVDIVCPYCKRMTAVQPLNDMGGSVWRCKECGRMFTQKGVYKMLAILKSDDIVLSCPLCGDDVQKDGKGKHVCKGCNQWIFKPVQKALASVQKPEETTNQVRIPVPGEAGKHVDHKIRTIQLSADQGVSALYCVEDKVIITYLFDKAKGWSLDKAKEWVSSHEKSAKSDSYESETEKINGNKETPEAQKPHRFIAAKWTHPNGHPRCLLCGQEERVGGMCEGLDKEKKSAKSDHVLEKARVFDYSVIKSEAEKRFTLGIVYSPDEVDAQADYMKADEVEKAAWNIMERLALGKFKIGLEHNKFKTSDGAAPGILVESYVWRAPDMELNGVKVTKGSWIAGVVWHPEAWELVKAGELHGYSFAGIASRES
jgi:2'-5' RNA ligase